MPVAVTALRGRLQDTLRFSAGPIAEAVAARTHDAERAAGGLFRSEPAAWSAEPGVQKAILDRLGWLRSPDLMAESVGRMRTFAAGIRESGFTDVVLLGMGGSSLAPAVLRDCVGIAPGWPRFHILDSTDPAAVLATSTWPQTTFYLLASKSGTTIEPASLAAHFRRTLQKAGIADWGRQFAAITDPDTPLDRRARADGFRDVFVNPPDIGGRYSALSFFGLVPAALMGQDIEAMIAWAQAMLAAAQPGFGEAATNPAVGLGLAIGAGAAAGRDKLTLVGPPSLEPFAVWVEQLVAESTGKNGQGIVPVAGEPVAADPQIYGADRLFVRSSFQGSRATDIPAVDAPIVDINVLEPAALGAEFVRWEIATAVAGALLGVNPFDEPNVQQAKDATRALLDRYTADRRLPEPEPERPSADGTTLAMSSAARRYAGDRGGAGLLTTIRQGDYFALLAYLWPDDDLSGELQSLRRLVRDRTGAATLLGYGPRYLHSTGQLHKGGPNTGVYLLISAAPRVDVDVPGQPFSFATLEQAQALGDFQALEQAGRRALYARLPAPDATCLRTLTQSLLARLP